MIEYPLNITSFDVFPNGTLKPAALLRYMQQAARLDCDQLGATYPYMRELNTVFMLTKVAFELYRPVKSGEDMVMKTYNNRIDGIYFDREFEFYINGELTGRASSFWVLVRFDTRRPMRPREFPLSFESLDIAEKILEIPRSLLPENPVLLEDRTVRVSDLDENNHLNNCVYTDIALDAVPGFDGLSQAVLSASVIFRHEAHLKDVLRLSYEKTETGSLISAENTSAGTPCFEAAFSFTPVG